MSRRRAGNVGVTRRRTLNSAHADCGVVVEGLHAARGFDILAARRRRDGRFLWLDVTDDSRPVTGVCGRGHVVRYSYSVYLKSVLRRASGKAVRVCAGQGFSVTATVVDPSGHQQAVIKGDTVPLQSLLVSYRKAYTAYSYGQAFNKDSTSALIAAKVTGPLDGAVLATVPEVLFIPGGVTLRKSDRTVIGGLGVSGAPGGDKDEACAQAAVDKYRADFQ